MLLCRNLAACVKEVQRELGLCSKEMAQYLGISPSALSGLLRGKGNPRLSTVERMAEKLGREPVLLLCRARSDIKLELYEQTIQIIGKVRALSPEKRRRFRELFQELAQYMADKD